MQDSQAEKRVPDAICIPALTAVSVVGCDLFVLFWISMQLRDLVIEFCPASES